MEFACSSSVCFFKYYQVSTNCTEIIILYLTEIKNIYYNKIKFGVSALGEVTVSAAATRSSKGREGPLEMLLFTRVKEWTASL